MLSDLTDPDAVHHAIAEFDELGREAFLSRYGYGPARRYFVSHNGHRYDSKAIVGAAHGFQHPDKGPLIAANFSAGEATVVPVLERLGFTVVEEGGGVEGSSAADLAAVLSEVCDMLDRRESGSTDFASEHLSALVRTRAVAAVRTLAGSLSVAMRKSPVVAM